MFHVVTGGCPWEALRHRCPIRDEACAAGIASVHRRWIPPPPLLFSMVAAAAPGTPGLPAAQAAAPSNPNA
jgi:hypothetical protein